MDKPRSALKKLPSSRHEENKHVTFANSPNKRLQQQKNQNMVNDHDHRKRQTGVEQSNSKKKMKLNEQTARLLQCDEFLSDIDYTVKSLDQKIWDHGTDSIQKMTEMGELECGIIHYDSLIQTQLDDSLLSMERSISRRVFPELHETEKIMNQCTKRVEDLESIESKISILSEDDYHAQDLLHNLSTIQQLLSSFTFQR